MVAEEQAEGRTMTKEEREQRLNRRLYLRMVDEARHGVKFYTISADDFFEKITSENLAIWKEINTQAAVVCQIGSDRSKMAKLLLVDAGIPPATTEEDRVNLSRRSSVAQSADVGMSFKTLGISIQHGGIDENSVVPANFQTTIKTVVGFIHGMGDLSDVELFSHSIRQWRKQYGIDQVDLEIILIDDKGLTVEAAVQRVRQRLGIA